MDLAEFQRLMIQELLGRPHGPLLKPCPFEGAVVEFSICRGEYGHVRFCDHPDAPWSRCVRSLKRVNDPDVRSCRNCPLRPTSPDGD